MVVVRRIMRIASFCPRMAGAGGRPLHWGAPGRSPRLQTAAGGDVCMLVIHSPRPLQAGRGHLFRGWRAGLPKPVGLVAQQGCYFCNRRRRSARASAPISTATRSVVVLATGQNPCRRIWGSLLCPLGLYSCGPISDDLPARAGIQVDGADQGLNVSARIDSVRNSLPACPEPSR